MTLSPDHARDERRDRDTLAKRQNELDSMRLPQRLIHLGRTAALYNEIAQLKSIIRERHDMFGADVSHSGPLPAQYNRSSNR